MTPMNESPEQRDAAARAAAIAPRGSVLLEAPAGSGKTSVLTRRFLRLLTTVEEPGQILAITFTRKAAAEMRARVIRALRGEFAATDREAAELTALAEAALAHGAARGWSIATQPQSLRIQTIDAFNYWLASQLPVASHAGGVLNVTDTAGELYRRAARRALLAAEADPVDSGAIKAVEVADTPTTAAETDLGVFAAAQVVLEDDAIGSGPAHSVGLAPHKRENVPEAIVAADH